MGEDCGGFMNRYIVVLRGWKFFYLLFCDLFSKVYDEFEEFVIWVDSNILYIFIYDYNVIFLFFIFFLNFLYIFI